MLDVRPVNLLQEIRSAETFRDEHLRSLGQQVERFHGPAWKGSYKWSELKYDPKNKAFQFIARFLPEVAGKNPRFSVRSKRGPAQRLVAEAMRHGMNRWARDTNVKTTVEQVATDAQFAYGVLCVVQMPSLVSDPGAQEPRMRPQMYRKSPRQFFMDPIAKDIRDARFQGHVFVVDKEDLLKRAKDPEHKDDGWITDVIEGLAADTGIEKLNRVKGAEVSRNELVGYSVWVPEHEIEFGEKEQAKYKANSWREAGFNGTILTLCVGQSMTGDTDGVEIRKPQPYYGPPSGPYQVIGMYYVPDSPTPLGTLTAVESQNQELNTHARAYLRSAARRKKIGIVGANDTLLQQHVKSAEDGEIVVANSQEIAKNFVEAELGGPTGEQRLSIIDLEANLNDALGTSSAVTGNVTGIATATENAIAAQGSGSRIAWNRTKFDTQFGEACNKVAWYLYHDDRVAFPLGDEAAGELGIEDPWFHGGTQGEGSGYTYEDLELEIEANSMALSDEIQEREKTLQAYSIIIGWLPLMMQFPVPEMWNAAIEDVGERFGLPDLAHIFPAEKIIQSGLMMMAAQAMAGAGAAGQGAPGGAQPQGPQTPMQLPKPRLAGDLGLSKMAGMGMAGGMKRAQAGAKPPAPKQKAGQARQIASVGGGY